MNWYIGQDIVALGDAKSGHFKKDDQFEIKALRSSLCKCKYVDIAIGITHPNPFRLRCGECGAIIDQPAGPIFFSEKCFAPLDSIADITELTEVITNTTPYSNIQTFKQ